jgi:hypothetical protein
MKERSEMIECIRGEIIGPARSVAAPVEIKFTGLDFIELEPKRRGPVVWRSAFEEDLEEVLYYDQESPHRKYGAGLLHSAGAPVMVQAHDPLGTNSDPDEVAVNQPDDEEDNEAGFAGELGGGDDTAEDFEVTSPDIRRPSSMGISFCVKLNEDGQIILKLPRQRRFPWQGSDSAPFQLNGRYESCKRLWTDDQGRAKNEPMWRRHPAVLGGTEILIVRNELKDEQIIRRDVTMPKSSPISLRIEVFPRRMKEENTWLLTVVLRNSTPITGSREPHECVLYQTYFEVYAKGGELRKYPESERPFAQLDDEEQSLALLYRESATWGIGHGCACGWDAEPSKVPKFLYADVMPAVELPSMTPDILDSNGERIQLSMRELANLSEDGTGAAWESLDNLSAEYRAWINHERIEASSLDSKLEPVALRHLEVCEKCLTRIDVGISLLKSDPLVRRAFRFTNLSMLLQQIGTKQLDKRPLEWNESKKRVIPQGRHKSPWQIYQASEENDRLGSWRAFQIAFLLMCLDGSRDEVSPDREIVDLIWFPTGGGKTEAYLAVMAFYMMHERLLMQHGENGPARDGTNVLMRYTLRMLTTQQFQRAASLICAMEFLRRNPKTNGIGNIPGRRFSLGLWIGRDGSPNKIRDAEAAVAAFRRGEGKGNPLILTECPWCRSEIGRYEGTRPGGITANQWNHERVKGLDTSNGALLLCSDTQCSFGAEDSEDWLPVEVIDERIFQKPPSLVISTVDKLAMIAYRPAAGALFGRRIRSGIPCQEFQPPGLIIQDELHLISGPLGTMYALYESIFERMCSYQHDGKWIKPKVISSTATIRGAADQVQALYARHHTNLFPGPGLNMGDSFFGKYARDKSEKLCNGRLYLGIHASDYGSVLTTQVRAFSSSLFRPFSFDSELRDPWWTLLAFYNSIRELGGAKTLFDSDIRSRLKFMFNREGFAHDVRRKLSIVEELTSRLSQSEIVGMMDRLSTPYDDVENYRTLDACLASNIIEVGVDIDRLSLMGVVGQPKTTATYIQVTGRVGRRWKDRAGLILMIYNPSKSRDRSHFEQFHSYHRRLYERVEPTSATPFALSAIQRGLSGAILAWVRQYSDASVRNVDAYAEAVEDAYQLLIERCKTVQTSDDLERSLSEMERVRDELCQKWDSNPQEWEAFPPDRMGEYLMLWPGQYATLLQKRNGLQIPSSMRQVDSSAELRIHEGYASPVPAIQQINP